MIRPAIAALAFLAAACSQPVPTVEAPAADATPLPALAEWITPYLGQPMATAFPTGTNTCRGFVDSVDTRYSGDPAGVSILGWGWDNAGKRALDKILITDDAGIVVGGGSAGVERKDVSAAFPGVVTSDLVGFNALAKITAGSAHAYGVDETNKSVCLLGAVAL